MKHGIILFHIISVFLGHFINHMISVYQLNYHCHHLLSSGIATPGHTRALSRASLHFSPGIRKWLGHAATRNIVFIIGVYTIKLLLNNKLNKLPCREII